jgi:hypothetical protein
MVENVLKLLALNFHFYSGTGNVSRGLKIKYSKKMNYVMVSDAARIPKDPCSSESLDPDPYPGAKLPLNSETTSVKRM